MLVVCTLRHMLYWLLAAHMMVGGRDGMCVCDEHIGEARLDHRGKRRVGALARCGVSGGGHGGPQGRQTASPGRLCAQLPPATVSNP